MEYYLIIFMKILNDKLSLCQFKQFEKVRVHRDYQYKVLICEVYLNLRLKSKIKKIIIFKNMLYNR